MTDRMLSVREVAERLKLKEQTLRKWRARGIGPRSLRIGGRVRYPESALRDYLAGLTTAEVNRQAGLAFGEGQA